MPESRCHGDGVFRAASGRAGVALLCDTLRPLSQRGALHCVMGRAWPLAASGGLHPEAQSQKGPAPGLGEPA